ncbi:Gamma-glutamyl cyclotransferase [Komagataella phaffii CBS 7435]|uniref:glutathione-specific gamma-glutamylcyclotransferase n=2 Tax=Komagataella phaffii TaxID=460519 RepID=C4QVW0_KOMPG|nr:uncharacterized protein PAS_chr1-1_0029 [Komagataella phaffii GS115]AOA60849.1 GQ67_02586T0 [Komagataella phaffii]CAH2446046.1 Gamma-glutamyl cyclotransferase [Komagataella phaffii CBS 7435]AOA65652.1 GQ68_02662T0 [Komagataella phaffii GS115]CAY67383.1 Putative protein of unknown function [Komagataella phaffii GS115]CCA36483.1 Gamma-glutamyl cyclotransferase [Komagataella phaffii CBS 7435]
MTNDAPLWVLGYGSLIFKPPPHATHKIPGKISGFVRRFWQSSTDHRGTPESPGRVVTLIPYADIVRDHRFLESVHYFECNGDKKNIIGSDLQVWGCIYYIPAQHREEVCSYLDVREQDGYTQHKVTFEVELDDEYFSQNPEIKEFVQSHTIVDTHTGKNVIHSLVYIGTTSNESFIGPEHPTTTAKVIRSNEGPSGSNLDYLKRLHRSLMDLDKSGNKRSHDRYLDELIQLVDKEDS